MRAITDGRLELTDRVVRHLELCLDCRSCETACPSGVQYGRLIEPFRVDMHKQGIGSTEGTAPRWFKELILHGLFPHAARLQWALWPMRLMQRVGADRVAESLGLMKVLPSPLRRMQRLLPRLDSVPPALPGLLPATPPRRARVALFTGCVADVMFRHVHWATARALQANGCDVVVPSAQGCCGAIHYHSGAGQPTLEFARRNLAAFTGAAGLSDVDAIITNVAGCGALLKDYGHIAEELEPTDAAQIERFARFAGRVRDISEFLVQLGPVPPPHAVPLRAVYHDACHLGHAQRVREQPRQLLSLVPELKLLPLGESEVCCGAAGSYNLTEPEMSDRLGARKVAHLIQAGANAVLSGNAGCTLQIQALLREAGQPLPVLHPVEVLDRAYHGTPAGG
jgi:glycolate oxidase iron-sulfur subunit